MSRSHIGLAELLVAVRINVDDDYNVRSSNLPQALMRLHVLQGCAHAYFVDEIYSLLFNTCEKIDLNKRETSDGLRYLSVTSCANTRNKDTYNLLVSVNRLY